MQVPFLLPPPGCQAPGAWPWTPGAPCNPRKADGVLAPAAEPSGSRPAFCTRPVASGPWGAYVYAQRRPCALQVLGCGTGPLIRRGALGDSAMVVAETPQEPRGGGAGRSNPRRGQQGQTRIRAPRAAGEGRGRERCWTRGPRWRQFWAGEPLGGSSGQAGGCRGTCLPPLGPGQQRWGQGLGHPARRPSGPWAPRPPLQGAPLPWGGKRWGGSLPASFPGGPSSTSLQPQCGPPVSRLWGLRLPHSKTPETRLVRVGIDLPQLGG